MDWTISSENDMLFRLAYSMGAFLGDGNFRYRPEYRAAELQIWKQDREVAEEVLKEVNAVFKVNYEVQEREDHGVKLYAARIGKLRIGAVFALATNWRNEVPREFFSASRDVKVRLIAGLMDTDGYVSYGATASGSGGPRWLLGFANTNLGLVQSLASMLQSLGVKVGAVITQPRKGYVDYYHIRPNMRSFTDAGLYFLSKRKQGRLSDWYKHVVGSETLYTGTYEARKVDASEL